jgi:cytoskeletal protein CcmA (bactofilin family)
MLVGKQSEGVGDIIGAQLQGRRGAIFVGDCRKLAENNEWKSFLMWCMENKLICTFRM